MPCLSLYELFLHTTFHSSFTTTQPPASSLQPAESSIDPLLSDRTHTLQLMSARGISNSKLLQQLRLYRGAKRREKHSVGLSGGREAPADEQKLRESIGKGRIDVDSSCWVPHPRTGIYFPRGHEKVMEDIPDGASSFSETYWLRDIDGVDKPSTDHPELHPLSYVSNPN